MSGLNEIEWWILKIATLLHDVPWKPWLITGLYRGRRVSDEILSSRDFKDYIDVVRKVMSGFKRLEAHEEESIALLTIILKVANVPDEALARLSRLWDMVHEADTVSASLDRLISPQADPLRFRRIRLVNPFNPTIVWPYRLDESKPDLNRVVKFANRIIDIAKNLAKEFSEGDRKDLATTLRKLYFILYAILEKLWYEEVGSKALPVADTRAPHHTVFNHVYAATTATNMVYSNEWLVVHVDIPGVQQFIAKGRKTRDYWAGSWILSYMVWSCIKPLIEYLGPDIVLTPSIHYNPFYLDLLIGMNVDEGLLPKIAWEPWRWPSQPVMPATVNLIIPLPKDADYISKAFSRLCTELNCQYDTEDPEQLIKCVIENSVKTTWKRLAESLLRKYERQGRKVSDLIKELCEHVGSEDVGKCCREFREYMEGLLKSPPFNIKVVSVRISWNDVKYILKEFEKKLEERGELGNVVTFIRNYVSSSEATNLYKFMRGATAYLYSIKKLYDKVEYTPNITVYVSPEASAHASRLSSKVYREGITHRYVMCSVCGQLPAVVYLRRGAIDEVRNYGYVIDEGEALCPYCFIRRLLAKYPDALSTLLPSIKRLGEVKGFIPSTADVANIWNIKLFKNLMKVLGISTEGIKPEVLSTYKLLYSYILTRVRNNELLNALTLADQVIGSRGGLDVVKRVGLLKEEAMAHYIAYIRGDGDSVGKIYQGVLALKLPRMYGGLEPHEAYMKCLLEISGVASGLEGNVVESWVKVYSSLLRGFVSLGLLSKDSVVIPTLSYIRTLSQSLMISSLIDARIAEAIGGVLIYAGGDDIALISPVLLRCDVPINVNPLLITVSKMLEDITVGSADELYRRLNRGLKSVLTSPTLLVIHLTRLNYWGMLPTCSDKAMGFHVYKEAIVPAPLSFGRSYGVALMHYRTPLWVGYATATDLEESKNEVSIKSCRGSSRVVPEKDLTIISYSEGEVAVIPNTLDRADRVLDVCQIHSVVSLILECVQLGSCSHSLIYEGTSKYFTDMVKKLVSIDEGLSRCGRANIIKLLYGRLLSTYANEVSTRDDLLNLSEWFVEVKSGRSLKDPLLAHVFRCLRIIHSASR